MRVLILVLTVFAVSFPLSAQGKALAGVDPRGVTISYWYQHSGVNGDAMQKMIAEFNAANEWKITVKGEYQGPYDQIYNKMAAAILL